MERPSVSVFHVLDAPQTPAAHDWTCFSLTSLHGAVDSDRDDYLSCRLIYR